MWDAHQKEAPRMADLDDLDVRHAVLYAVGSICDDEGAQRCLKAAPLDELTG